MVQRGFPRREASGGLPRGGPASPRGRAGSESFSRWAQEPPGASRAAALASCVCRRGPRGGRGRAAAFPRRGPLSSQLSARAVCAAAAGHSCGAREPPTPSPSAGRGGGGEGLTCGILTVSPYAPYSKTYFHREERGAGWRLGALRVPPLDPPRAVLALRSCHVCSGRLPSPPRPLRARLGVVPASVCRPVASVPGSWEGVPVWSLVCSHW